MEFVSGSGSSITNHIESSKLLMTQIIRQMSTSNPKTIISTEAFHSRVSDDEALNELIDEFDISEESVHILGGSFCDIVGCCQAKRSLVENVILPFSCLPAVESHIFQGTIAYMQNKTV